MNWGRAKTILIILFLITDLFLMTVLVRIKIMSVQISQETIEQTVTIMKAGGIGVEPQQISSKRIENRSMIMQNFFQEPDHAAVKLLGENVKTVVFDSEQYVYQYESSRGVLDICEEQFEYRNGREPEPYREHPLPDKEAVLQLISDNLQSFGFKRGSYVAEDVWEQEGIYHVTMIPIADGVKIYGIRMHITADSKGILSISGHWFESVGMEENDPVMLMDVTSVLTEMSLKKQIPAVQISDISHGYYAAGDFLSSRELAAVPVYVIEDETGKEYMFDARIGVAVE